MDVLRLSGSTYRPDAIVEGYTSMIWTERFKNFGSFELKTSKIEETFELLPLGSGITLLDSDEVMQVENHSLERTGGSSELTVTGRTIETFLENRIMKSTVYGASWFPIQPYRDAEIIDLLLWNHLVNATGQDPTEFNKTIYTDTAVTGVVVTDSTSIADTTKLWALEAGEVYPKVQNFLGLTKLGVRNIRAKGSSAKVVNFDTSSASSRGTISKTTTNNIWTHRIDVYHGTDRTANQTIREPVIFNYEAGHIDSPKYLVSNENVKNVATVISAIGGGEVWAGAAQSGAYKKAMLIDAGTPAQGQNTTDFLNAAVQKATIELAKHEQVVLFDGTISSSAPYKYGRDYFLGDYVTLMGEYNFQESMMISEYIRTSDMQGNRAFPGLTRLVSREVYSDTVRKNK